MIDSFWIFRKDWMFIYSDNNPTSFMFFSRLIIFVLLIFFFWICLQIIILVIDFFFFLNYAKCISVELSLPTTIQANENQTFIPKNCDQRPSLVEKNKTTHVYEIIVCFFLNMMLTFFWPFEKNWMFIYRDDNPTLFVPLSPLIIFVLFILFLNLSSN